MNQGRRGGKVKYHELSKEEKIKFLGDFYSMIALLKNRGEVKNFFKDLLTLSEAVMLSRRIQIAMLLLEGKTHEEIKSKLKVGFSTITSVEKWLHAGFGGYNKILKRYQSIKSVKESKMMSIAKRSPLSFDWLRHKYPLHFLLVNMILDKKK